MRTALLALSVALAAFAAARQEQPAAPPAPALPPPLTTYLGRTIAPTMSYEGGPWLQRVEREKEERCPELLKALHLKAGDVVADVGCGNGFYTYRIAPLVGEKGRVFALDVQPEMLDQLKAEGKKHEKVANVTPVLGTVVDPKLPAASIDLALLVDVYHEFDHPVEMLAALKRSLKPKGRLVLVEFRLEDPDVPIKLLHKMSKEQMKKELAANGFEAVEEYDGLPWQHVVFFAPRKEDAPKKDEAAKPAGDQPARRDQ